MKIQVRKMSEDQFWAIIDRGEKSQIIACSSTEAAAVLKVKYFYFEQVKEEQEQKELD